MEEGYRHVLSVLGLLLLVDGTGIVSLNLLVLCRIEPTESHQLHHGVLIWILLPRLFTGRTLPVLHVDILFL